MASRKLIVEIVGDSRSLERAFGRSTKSAKQFQMTFSGLGRSMAGGLGAITGITSGIYLLSTALDTAFTEMRESRKVTAQTGAVIRSTGKVAGVTAAHVQHLGDTLLRKTGIDDEAIRSGANLLLTFTNIRNVVGQNNDIFDQATDAALDMSVALGTDMRTAALQVGKALQDPVRGTTALRRAGVILTASQQRTIATLVRTGRVMDAQKIILRELNREFGGSAAAAGRADGGINRLRETVVNFLGVLAEEFAPAIEDASTALQEWFDDPENVRKTKEEVGGFARAVGGAAKGLKEANDTGNRWMDSLRHGINVTKETIRATTLRGFSPFSDWAKREREESLAELRALAAEGEAITHSFADAVAEHLSLKGRQRPTGAKPPGAGGGGTGGVSRSQRNQWFDTRIAREINRTQDLSMRKQLARLKEIAKEVRARLAVTKDITRRLTLEDKLTDILRQQRNIQQDIAGAIQDANDALKDRAEAIKSAVLDRLQRKQTDILNKRNLEDAKEALRLARQAGGPMGIKAAVRGMQDVRFDMERARIENAPATLTKGGQFALGNIVTVNVHGVTDPDAVARAVIAAMQRRGRRTTSQSRGPATAH